MPQHIANRLEWYTGAQETRGTRVPQRVRPLSALRHDPSLSQTSGDDTPEDRSALIWPIWRQ